MTEHGFTPGPWELMPMTESRESGVLEIGIKTKEYLNHVVIYGDGGEQHQADARLVTAAPDLLAACEYLVTAYEQVGGFSDPEATTAYLEAAKAIAKVKGEDTNG